MGEHIKLLPCPFCGAPGTTERHNGKRVNCSSGLIIGECYLGEYSLPLDDWQHREDKSETTKPFRVLSAEAKQHDEYYTEKCKLCRDMKWISVVDELPEYGKWLFVSDGAGTHFAAYVEHLGFLGTDGEAFDSCVKFWMNLPTPPTGV
jgi:hypothetical protein